ncbi:MULTISPECIES: glycosyltransferase family 4 protein [unclassified Bradyrhizobium]|uniref:glycosyltransferase family 4 protein n=1 Tax=unclassified Bradyrhizobium TaxID=2631580 RepID=UPI002FF0BCA1
MIKALRIFYAAGPGNVIGVHEHWKANADDPGQMSLTYSGQFEDLCRELNADAYIVSYNSERKHVHDGRTILEHRPKRVGKSGISYHLSEIAYGISLLKTAKLFRADLALISSGSTYYFVLSLFRLFGIKVVPVLHNTLWPAGSPPKGFVQRVILRLDAIFFRWLCTASVSISPECARQISEISGSTRRLHLMYPQFRREVYDGVPPPRIEVSPFKIVFAGRIEANKGVFDLLEMARSIENKTPGKVQWDVCGSGGELDELKRRQKLLGLEDIVSIHGHTSPQDLREILGRSHLSIVPTRTDFAEGISKSAIEGILVGRPVITSAVTPALDVLRPACVEAETNNVLSYVDGILTLIDDRDRYRRLAASCRDLQALFYDREHGFAAALKRLIKDCQIEPSGSTASKCF